MPCIRLVKRLICCAIVRIFILHDIVDLPFEDLPLVLMIASTMWTRFIILPAHKQSTSTLAVYPRAGHNTPYKNHW